VAPGRKGFRAPNLEQTKTVAIFAPRLEHRFPALRSRPASAAADSQFRRLRRNISYSIFVSGNPDLKPENSTNYNRGRGASSQSCGRPLRPLTLTADFWSIKQVGIVGQFGPQNALVLDYLLRLQGSSNPNVIREPPTADDIAAFAGTGLRRSGAVTQIRDQFVNLLPQTVQGSISPCWQSSRRPGSASSISRSTRRGCQISRAHRATRSTCWSTRARRATSTPATPLARCNAESDRGERASRNGAVTASLTWSLDEFQIGAFARYTGAVDETAFVDADGDPWRSQVAGHRQPLCAGAHQGSGAGIGGDMRWRLGVRNIADEEAAAFVRGLSGVALQPLWPLLVHLGHHGVLT
jgi:iron complex outermembrane receptor protein